VVEQRVCFASLGAFDLSLPVNVDRQHESNPDKADVVASRSAKFENANSGDDPPDDNRGSENKQPVVITSISYYPKVQRGSRICLIGKCAAYRLSSLHLWSASEIAVKCTLLLGNCLSLSRK